MKTWVVAVVVLVLGSAVGVARSWMEFQTYGNHFQGVNQTREVGPGVVASTNNAAGPQPKAVVVGGGMFDFGEMDHLTSSQHDFEIRNEGDAPLELKLGRTTCKCTLGELNDGTLPPGRSTKITVEWKTVSTEATFQQAAQVLTNDPRQPELELIVRGSIRQRVVIAPDHLVFTDIPGSQASTASFAIYTTDLPDFEIVEHQFLNSESAKLFELSATRLKDDPELLKTMRELRTGANGGLKVLVTVKPGMPGGPFKQTARVKTNTDLEPIELRIEGNVIGDIAIAGGAGFDRSRGVYDFGIVESAAGAEASLFVIVKGAHRDKTTLSIDSVEPTDSLQVELGEANATERVITYSLKIRIPKGSKEVNRLGSEQGKMGKILIRTTHPDDKEITVRIRYAIEN